MGKMPIDGQGLRTLRVPDPDNANSQTLDFQAATNLTLGDLTVMSGAGAIAIGTVTISDTVGGATYTEPDGTVVAAKIPGNIAPPLSTANTADMEFNVPKGKWVRLYVSQATGLAIMSILGPIKVVDVPVPSMMQGAVAGTGAVNTSSGFMPPTPVQVPTSTH